MAKNIILVAITALVLAPTAVSAADLAVKAPPPVAIYDWTGFYIGVSGGGSLGTSDHIDRATGLSDTSGYNVKGGLVGGTLGYNWQLSNFVVGFEGDVSWVDEHGSMMDLGPVGDPAFTSFTRETWMATARARFGYAVNNLLFYGTGGYAAAGVEAGIKDSNSGALLASTSSTRSGWTAGGGLEWGFAPNWSAKFEMLYMKFNSAAFNTVQAEGARTVPLDDTIARVGINYRFGGPVVAKF
ncbi:MAG TPA: outer membrane protein [Bradyrhizobium sp.]|nr:outer membrane protein [Bradyrhizobium sp.]